MLKIVCEVRARALVCICVCVCVCVCVWGGGGGGGGGGGKCTQHSLFASLFARNAHVRLNIRWCGIIKKLICLSALFQLHVSDQHFFLPTKGNSGIK